MLEPSAASLLEEYYRAFLSSEDVERFRQDVTARYSEGTLVRLLHSGRVEARRASVLALGLIGSMKVNADLARCMADEDPTVRSLSQSALWAIWFRADTPENNATLAEVSDLIQRGRYAEAEALATQLIARSKRFAEAHNQRAIARFFQEKFRESAADCRQALALNPFHTGALSGLGQCYLRLGQGRAALDTFRRALKLQPHSESLRETIANLEAIED